MGEVRATSAPAARRRIDGSLFTRGVFYPTDRGAPYMGRCGERSPAMNGVRGDLKDGSGARPGGVAGGVTGERSPGRQAR